MMIVTHLYKSLIKRLRTFGARYRKPDTTGSFTPTNLSAPEWTAILFSSHRICAHGLRPSIHREARAETSSPGLRLPLLLLPYRFAKH